MVCFTIQRVLVCRGVLFLLITYARPRVFSRLWVLPES